MIASTVEGLIIWKEIEVLGCHLRSKSAKKKINNSGYAQYQEGEGK